MKYIKGSDVYKQDERGRCFWACLNVSEAGGEKHATSLFFNLQVFTWQCIKPFWNCKIFSLKLLLWVGFVYMSYGTWTFPNDNHMWYPFKLQAQVVCYQWCSDMIPPDKSPSAQISQPIFFLYNLFIFTITLNN